MLDEDISHEEDTLDTLDDPDITEVDDDDEETDTTVLVAAPPKGKEVM